MSPLFRKFNNSKSFKTFLLGCNWFAVLCSFQVYSKRNLLRCCSSAKSCPTLCNPMDCSMPESFTVSGSLLRLMSLESLILSNHLILWRPLSSCLQSFPASGSFPVSWLFASGGQSIGASVLASILPMNIQDWFPLGLTGLISLLSKGLSRVFSSTSLKASILWRSAFFMVQLSHLYMTNGKTIALTRRTFVNKVMSLLFNMLSRFVIAFLPRSKCPFEFHGCSHHSDFGAQEKVTVSNFSPSVCHVGHYKEFSVLYNRSLLVIYFIYSSVYIREGNGTPLQYSGLENPMDGGAW